MEAIAWKQILVLLLPVVGSILKSIPKVNNQLIPVILSLLAAIKSYWLLAGLPTEVLPPPVVADPEVAGILGELGQVAISLAWGSAEAFIATRFHKSYKYRADAKRFPRPGWV